MKKSVRRLCLLLAALMILTTVVIAVSADDNTDPANIIGYSDALVGDAFRYLTQGKASTKAVDVDSLQDIKTWDGSWPASENSFKVTDVEGLVMLSNAVNSGAETFYGLNIFMANDIDFAAPENAEWAKKFVPIGYNIGVGYVEGETTYKANAMFGGTFDGRGYAIKNMNLEYADKTLVTASVMKQGKEVVNKFLVCQVGLFGMVNNNANGWASEIRNVKMENCTIVSAATTNPPSKDHPNGQNGWGAAALIVARSQGGLAV